MARPKRIETVEERKARQAGYVQRWREKNPEKQRLARKRAYLNRKRKAFSLIGKAECNRCGCDELDFLEFNHKNGNGCKDWRESGGVAMMDRVLTMKRSVEDLEILCRVCNALEFLQRKNPQSATGYQVRYHKLVTDSEEGWEEGTPNA